MTEPKKTQPISVLRETIRQHKQQSQTVVHCHGVFDLLHIGHIRYLQKASTLGDILVVTVTPDRHVNKGPHRPVFEETLRADAVAAIDCVDYVAVNEWPTAIEALERLQPDIYAKGAEFRDHKTPELLREEATAASIGARVEFIDEITSSSSHLINNYLSPFSDDTEHYLRQMRTRFSVADILHYVRDARRLKVLVVGEAIIDEYYSCSTLGRSTKAPMIATRYDSHDRFAGGALAVANHLAGFCDQVGLVTLLGTENSEDAWIHSQLRPNITARFLYKEGAPTIIKRQYRESYFGTPLFEMNSLNDDPLTQTQDDALCATLRQSMGDYDVVVVADYGHTMLGHEALGILCDHAQFLTVNTQANAGNVGFHTIGRYDRADYVSLAEQEIRLECRSRSGPLEPMLKRVAQKLLADTVAVTVGKRGCLCYHDSDDWYTAPALATKVVDRFGAGDAFFAMTSLCAALRAPTEILAFLGNAAAAETVSTLGNSSFLELLHFQRHVESLMK